MDYYLDLKNIGMDQYKMQLKVADLLPSRMKLKDNLDTNFESIKQQGVTNLADLRVALKTKDKLQDFSKQSGVAEDYLKILIREVNSFRQKPSSISDFPDTSETLVLALKKLGIKNTLQLFNRVLTAESRAQLAKELGVSKQDILRLTKLTDLSRIRWVNHTFAYVLLEAGYDTAVKVAEADYNVLYETVKELNKERQLYKGHIGLHDMKLCVEAAKDVPHAIQD